MSLRRSFRRSFRRSKGDGSATGRGPDFVVGNVVDVGEVTVGGQDTVESNSDPTTMAGKMSGSNDKSDSIPRQKRLFVGDSVEFCPTFTHTNTASKKMPSATEDAKEAATSIAHNSVETTGTASTDSIVSSSTTSSNHSKRPKRMAPPQSSSSSSSLVSETNGMESPKKKHRPLFGRKLRITLHAVRREDFELKTASSKENAKHRNDKVDANGENKHCNTHEPCKADAGQITIQKILSLRSERFLQAQSNLTLSQLKQQARQKARAKSKPARRVQPKRRKRCKNGRRQKPKLPASSNESETLDPMDKIEMNTGTLYLYRGENPRAKFVWRK